MEHAQWLHLVNALLSAYLFVVFIWWWARNGDTTFIYRITCMLMFGLTVTHGGAWYLYQHPHLLQDDVSLLNSWYWPLRQYMVMIPLIVYAIHITHKILTTRNGINRKRRKDDK